MSLHDSTVVAVHGMATGFPPDPSDHARETYLVIGDPPVLAGAVQVTVACPSPGATVTPPGGPGVVLGVTSTAVDAAPGPAAFTARTRTRYAVPFTSPVTAIGLAVDAGLLAIHVVPSFVDHS